MYDDENDGGLREYQDSQWQAEYQEWIAAMEAVGEVKFNQQEKQIENFR